MQEALGKTLDEALSQLGMEAVSESQRHTLLAYLDLLHKWNKVYNLTAIRSPEQMLVRHIIDSLAVAPYLQAKRLIDVGSGGGLPGIPLSIVRPESQWVLLDTNSKKTRFLLQAKAELGLDNIEVVHGRAETYQPTPLFDAAISRAFASIEDMTDLSLPLVKPGGLLLAMKGAEPEKEIGQLPENLELSEIIVLQVPFLHEARHLVVLKKRF